MLTGESLRAKSLEMGDQLLALREEPALAQDSRPDASLYALHEAPVLLADLVVEGDQLVDPGLVHVRREEVIEEPRRPLGADREHGAAGQVRVSGKDVQAEVRPEEVELAARHLPAGEKRVAVLAESAELARHEPLRFEPVGVGRDVDGGAEARVRDGAVVALEEVLARDLPVRFQLELAAETKFERLDVKDLRELRRHFAERLEEGDRIGIGIHEHERTEGVDRDLPEPELVVVEPGLAIRAWRRAQPSVERVGPRVIGALQGLARPGSARHDVSAVAADVEKCPELAVPRACNHYRDLAGPRCEKACLHDLSRVSHVLPRAREDPFAL